MLGQLFTYCMYGSPLNSFFGAKQGILTLSSSGYSIRMRVNACVEFIYGGILVRVYKHKWQTVGFFLYRGNPQISPMGLQDYWRSSGNRQKNSGNYDQTQLSQTQSIQPFSCPFVMDKIREDEYPQWDQHGSQPLGLRLRPEGGQKEKQDKTINREFKGPFEQICCLFLPRLWI